MLSTYRRPIDDLDLKALTHERGSFQRNVITRTVPASVIVFGVVYLLRRSLLIAGTVAAALFVGSLRSNFRFFRSVKRRKIQKQDAAAVEVLEVSALSIVDVEPLGDNAPAYCFFVGERKALLLVGQWLLRYEPFPVRVFRLHRWADTKEPIRIDSVEQPITAEPSAIRLRRTHRFGKIEVFDASPETLQEDLDRALIRHESFTKEGRV